MIQPIIPVKDTFCPLAQGSLLKHKGDSVASHSKYFMSPCHPQDTFQTSHLAQGPLWSGLCLPSQPHLSPFSPCFLCPPLPPCGFPPAPGPLHSRSVCQMCMWQSHSLKNLFLILTPADESEKLQAFINSSSPPNPFIILSVDSDTSRSFCVSEPQTELGRPLEGPSPIPDFS